MQKCYVLYLFAQDEFLMPISDTDGREEDACICHPGGEKKKR